MSGGYVGTLKTKGAWDEQGWSVGGAAVLISSRLGGQLGTAELSGG